MQKISVDIVHSPILMPWIQPCYPFSCIYSGSLSI